MLNVAVVGLGWWGKMMLRSLASSAQVRVVAAVEPNAAPVMALCESAGLALHVTLDAALTDPGVDAVILTTPNRLHEEQIVASAEHGKHVFCEKPLALTLASAERAVEACRKHGVRLGIGHERRFEPPMLMLRQALASGVLGRLLQIEGNFSQNKFLALAPDNWRLARAEAGCGPMTATGIHLLDLACSFAGPAREVRASVSALATGFESGDSASAQILFDDGVTATINAMLSTPFYSRFAVYGSRGWFEVRDKSHVESPSGWIVTRTTMDGGTDTLDLPAARPVRDNVDAFALAVAGEQADYPVGLHEMLDTTSLLEAVAEAATRGVPVKPRLSGVVPRAIETADAPA